MTAMFRQPRTWVVMVGWSWPRWPPSQFWHWVVERVEVTAGPIPGALPFVGQGPPRRRNLAPDDSYKGVMAEVLPEGRHFSTHVLALEKYPIVSVPPDKCTDSDTQVRQAHR